MTMLSTSDQKILNVMCVEIQKGQKVVYDNQEQNLYENLKY